MGRIREWLTAPVESMAAARDMPAGPPLINGLASPWADSSILQSVTFAGLWPLASAPVTRASVVAIPAVSRGRDLIAISCGSLPIYALTRDGALHPQPAIVEQPEAGRPRSVTLAWTVDSMLFHGVAWWLVTDRAPDTRPRQVRWVPPWSAEVVDGQLVKAFDLELGKDFQARDVIRFDGPHEGILNRSTALWNRIAKVTRSIDRQSDNPIPSVELHQTTPDNMTQTEIDALVASWAAARSGENGGVAYTNSAIQVITHGLPAEQLLLGMGERLDLECARALGLPAWAIDAAPGGSSITYSNPWSRARELIDYSLRGYLTAIADRLSLDDILPRGTWATFDTDPLTDGDFAERMTAAKAAIDAGLYTVDQLIQREKGLPLEDTAP